MIQIKGKEIKDALKVWEHRENIYILFSNLTWSRYKRDEIVIEENEPVFYQVPNEKGLATLFDIPLFFYDEGYPVDEEGSQYTEVYFFFPSMQPYNGRAVTLTDNMDVSVWDDDGNLLLDHVSWLVVVKEFQEIIAHCEIKR